MDQAVAEGVAEYLTTTTSILYIHLYPELHPQRRIIIRSVCHDSEMSYGTIVIGIDNVDTRINLFSQVLSLVGDVSSSVVCLLVQERAWRRWHSHWLLFPGEQPVADLRVL